MSEREEEIRRREAEQAGGEPSGDGSGDGAGRAAEGQGAGKKRRTREVEGYWMGLDIKRQEIDPEEKARRVAEARERRRIRELEMQPGGPGHRRKHMLRQLRGRAIDTAAVLTILVLGLAVTLAIISQQKASLPSWVPFFGEEFFEVEAELTSAQALTPGQGQAVMVAGIEVGQIASVSLEDGHAVVGMDIEPKYEELIRADASLLVRPKTNLQDMVVEIDPGRSEEPMPDGGTIPLSRTQPNVNPDQFFARLDEDTRGYLLLLLRGGAEGVGGKQRELSAGLRRFEPFTRYIAKLNGALEKRQQAIARSIHGFRMLTEELARHDAELGRFVAASASSLGGFASQQEAIREALRELPSTLRTTRGALEVSNELSSVLRPTLTALIPQAAALKPGLEATQEFFTATEPALGDQLRPFARQVRPVVRHTLQLSAPFEKTVDKFGKALGHLNYGFNELAYNPGAQRPGYLFYLPWLNHNLNAGYSFQDADGPVRRGVVLVSCRATDLAGGHVQTRPYLNTIYQATNVPTSEEVC